jgi:4-carboxymuconolactone decarboxylase
MSDSDTNRTPSRPTWRDIMQADPPPVNDPYTEFTTEHLFGRVWARSGLDRRDRRLVTLTIAAVTAQRDSLTAHLRAALGSGDLTADELHEWVLHLAHYGGWPAGTTAYAVLRDALAGGKV